MQLKAGTTLQNGKYRIIRVLGQGGFGITYLAEHTLLGKGVAIKEFFPKEYCGRNSTSHLTLGTQSNSDTVGKLKARFLKEARNISSLDHEGIIKIHDIFEENSTAYYVMDYIDGENLNDMVKRTGPLSEKKAVDYIVKVGKALEYIHGRNMTHFDVKPANIVVRRSDDTPVLIDFGLSKQYDKSGDATSTLMQGISQGYSPIELYNYGSIATFSPQTDVYSLAATLYYLVTGTVPPAAAQVIEEGISIPSRISQTVRQAIKNGMQTSRSKRTASIPDFLTALEGEEVTRVIEVNPEPNPGYPQIDYFKVSKLKDLHVGDEVILSWETTGAESVFLGSSRVAVQGEKKVKIYKDGSIFYVLKVSNKKGVATKRLNVNVKKTESDTTRQYNTNSNKTSPDSKKKTIIESFGYYNKGYDYSSGKYMVTVYWVVSDYATSVSLDVHGRSQLVDTRGNKQIQYDTPGTHYVTLNVKIGDLIEKRTLKINVQKRNVNHTEERKEKSSDAKKQNNGYSGSSNHLNSQVEKVNVSNNIQTESGEVRSGWSLGSWIFTIVCAILVMWGAFSMVRSHDSSDRFWKGVLIAIILVGFVFF